MKRLAAEVLRKRHAYRQMILRGRVRLPREAAARLLGPDCAYHLYAQSRGAGSAVDDRQR